MAHALDEYKDLIGKVSPEKIAETAGVSLADVEAWIGGLAETDAAEVKGEKARRIPAKAPATPAPKARKVEVIRVLLTTAIAIPGKRGKVRLPVQRSIYRGDIARKYASILKASEFEVIAYAD